MGQPVPPPRLQLVLAAFQKRLPSADPQHACCGSCIICQPVVGTWQHAACGSCKPTRPGKNGLGMWSPGVRSAAADRDTATAGSQAAAKRGQLYGAGRAAQRRGAATVSAGQAEQLGWLRCVLSVIPLPFSHCGFTPKSKVWVTIVVPCGQAAGSSSTVARQLSFHT